MTENAQDKARQAVETVVKSPELVEQILSDEYVQIMIARRFHSGPLPPPSDLAQYNDIISNGADRIMAMAEKEQAVRHETIRQDNLQQARATVRLHQRHPDTAFCRLPRMERLPRNRRLPCRRHSGCLGGCFRDWKKPRPRQKLMTNPRACFISARTPNRTYRHIPRAARKRKPRPPKQTRIPSDKEK